MNKVTLDQAKELLKLVTQSGIPKNEFQAMLQSGKFTTLLNEFQEEIIIRSVSVDYTRTPKKALKATRAVENTDNSVVAAMPVCGQGVNNKVEVVFFKLPQVIRVISNYDLVKEYEKRGLKPDPYAVAAVNEADLKFADEHPNGTQWQDEDGKFCIIAFQRNARSHVHERHVFVGHPTFPNWEITRWFGGVRVCKETP